MLDLFLAKIEDFAPYVGQTFILYLDGQEIPLVLEKAALLPSRNRPAWPTLASRPPFSLFWRGPLEAFLEQGMYTLRHPSPEIGLIENLVIAPVGQKEQGYVYQAVFN